MSQKLLFEEELKVAACHKCKLELGCKTPQMPTVGRGERKILVVGEAPGQQEDDLGKPFVGKSGQLLAKELQQVGVDLNVDCWRTNAVICRPPANKLPPKAVDYCRPNLLKVIEHTKPEVIILVGGSAVKSLIGYLWRENPGDIGRWVGWRIPSQQLNAWVCPVYHPAYLMRQQDDKPLWAAFRSHLAAAAALSGPPWPQGAPDYHKRVELVYDQQEAAERIDELNELNEPVAFDYETDRLKPDHDDARIVCCGVSGPSSFAFPWHGKAREAMGRLLKSKVPKIGANIKFEDRWTRKEFGHRVRGWDWDTMQAAHVMDSRPGISGVKFQSFVRLGMQPYDDKVGPLLKSKGDTDSSPNRIDEADLDELLTYCALDALLEYKIADSQRRELGWEN